MKFEWSNDIAVDFENVACDINVGDLFEKLNAISFNTTQKRIDNLCHHLNEKIISTAKAVGAYREIKKSKSRNSVQVKSPPWLDKECMEKRQQYYRVKNSLKRSGAKAMSYEKAKNFKKFITVKKKYYYNQLKNKIRTLRSSNSKDYWKLLNKYRK